MSEHRDEHLDLCAALALGSLDEADRERLERHLATGCEVCEAAIADFSSATVLLAASVPAAPAPRALRQRVLEAVAAVPRREGLSQSVAPEPDDRARGGARESRGKVIELRPRPRSSAFPAWIPTLAAAGLAVTSVLFWNQARVLRADLATRGREIADITTRLSEAEQLNRVLSAPGARVAVLEITPQGERELRARATYDPATRDAVVIFENLKAPPGHDYQLWGLHGATPASLGVIQTDASGRAVLHLDDAGDPGTLAAFAISLEPAGGSPNPAAPSGPVVMLGKLSI